MLNFVFIQIVIYSRYSLAQSVQGLLCLNWCDAVHLYSVHYTHITHKNVQNLFFSHSQIVDRRALQSLSKCVLQIKRRHSYIHDPFVGINRRFNVTMMTMINIQCAYRSLVYIFCTHNITGV